MVEQVWRTDDGRLFSTQREVLDHEAGEVRLNKIVNDVYAQVSVNDDYISFEDIETVVRVLLQGYDVNPKYE